MKGDFNYWLAQALILLFYCMTLFVYYRARNEYMGGKIGAAINLILVSLLILLLSDFVDYYFVMLFPVSPDTTFVIKLLLRLVAVCVLFFGGVRFFTYGLPSAFSGRGKRPKEPLSATGVSSTDAASRTEILDPDAVSDSGEPDQMPTLGRYEILSQLGRGAMGIVYKGRDPKLDRFTAIKTIRFLDEFDEDQVESVKADFYREAQVVARLSHPNIVTLYDVGEDYDLSYLAMEYLEGQSLTAFTRPGRLLPVNQCINTVMQVCDALAYAHSRQIVHRDIKPENIMMMEDGKVKVMDFGIARLEAGTRTRTGIIKGTPQYMSPEQTRGEKLTGASDLFSLGVVFYQLLTGKLPFEGETLAAIMYQLTMAEPKPPEKYNSDIDPQTAAILKRALAKSVKDRYQDAEVMGSELRQALKKRKSGAETS